jgi:hypothetical protein
MTFIPVVKTVNLGATDNAVLDAIQTATEAAQTALEATLTVDGTIDLGATDNAVLDSIQTAVEACQTALEATLTVDGTVTANLGATDNAVLDSIQAAAEAIQTAVEATLTISGTVDLGATDNAVLDAIQAAAEAIQTAIEGTVTVDGTVTANLGATDNAVLDSIDSDTSDIKTAVEILDNAIDGTEMQVDVVASLPAGTNAIGKLAANSGVDIGDVDVTSIAAGTNNIGSVAPYAQPASFVSGQTSDITGTSSTSVIAAQGAGVVIYITSIMVTNADADTGTVVKILDGSTTLWRGYAAAEGGGFAITFPVPLKCSANTAVNAQCETTGATVQVNVAGYKA